MRARIILRPMELLCAPKRQCPSRRFSEFLAGFEFPQPLQFLVDALDAGDEDLLALDRVLRRSGEASAPRLGLSFRRALSLPRECALFVMKIPKPCAKALEPVARHVSDRGMVRIANDFLFVVPQNADFKLAGSRHRILLVQDSIKTLSAGRLASPAKVTAVTRFQNDPSVEPRSMTATRAMSALTIPTMTISR